MKLNLVPLVCACLAAVAACAPAESEGGNDTGQPVALVSLSTAKIGTVTQRLKVYGVVQSEPAGQQVLLAPSQATVISIGAPAGTVVAEGDTVVRLAVGPQANVDLVQARADAKAADDMLARALRLRHGGLASDADVNSARAASDKANALFKSLQQGNAGLQVKATVAGQIQGVSVKVGDLVSLGTPLATIIRTSPALRARFDLDPSVARRVGPGTSVDLDVPGGGAIQATLSAVDVATTDTTGLVSAWVDLPSAKGSQAQEVVPGENIVARIPVAGSESSPLVPYSALLDDGGQPFVYVVTDGIAHRRNVETGPDDGKQIAIRKGVSPGDKVVTSGGTALEDGMRIRLK